MLSIAEINNLVTKTKQLLDDIEKKVFSKVAMVVDPVLRKKEYQKFMRSLVFLFLFYLTQNLIQKQILLLKEL